MISSVLRAPPAPPRGHSAALGLRPAALTDPTEQNPHPAQARLGAAAQQHVPARCWEPTGSAQRPECNHSSDRGLSEAQSTRAQNPAPPEPQQRHHQPHLLHKALSRARGAASEGHQRLGDTPKTSSIPFSRISTPLPKRRRRLHFPAATSRRAQHTNAPQARMKYPAQATPSPPAVPKEGAAARKEASAGARPATTHTLPPPPRQDAGALLLSAAGTPCSSPWKPAAL